jgi:hypothetical protein
MPQVSTGAKPGKDLGVLLTGIALDEGQHGPNPFAELDLHNSMGQSVKVLM